MPMVVPMVVLMIVRMPLVCVAVASSRPWENNGF